MKLIYIAGKYSGENYKETDENIRIAVRAALGVIEFKWRFGWFPITPHLNSKHFERFEFKDIHKLYFYDGTMALLRKCDAVLAISNWKGSAGAMAEIQEADRLGIPVYFSINEIPEK